MFFPGRSHFVWYSGAEAWLVSLFWFGAALALTFYFGVYQYRRPYQSPRLITGFILFGFVAMGVGLLSAIYFVVVQ
jgi:hypothetical protein